MPRAIYNEISALKKTTVYDKKRKDKELSLVILVTVSSQ